MLTLTDMIRGPRPLKDHVATVSAYLNDYKTQTDVGAQSENSGKFTYYLISTCWPKMLRRITSWQAMGFMYLIRRIPLHDLHTYGQTWEDFPVTSGPGDRSLVSFLKAIREDNGLKQNVLLDHCDPSDLCDQSHVSQFLNNLDVGSAGAPLAPVFSKETVLEFHKLTIAAFNGYKSTFTELDEAYTNLVSIGY